MEPAIRRATPGDAASVAATYYRARDASVPAIPPSVHDADDVARWWAEVVFPAMEVWLAEDDSGAVVGVMALSPGWLEQLYILREWTGQGLGSRFLALARERQPGGLQLWAFQSNLGARRFYERHGFVPVEFTDGASNEERAPDVRYAWTPPG